MNKKLNVLVSGGGTGGHIFPAIAIVEALEKMTAIEVLFVGAEGRMEMEKIPALGYKIEGLPIAGFQRGLSFSNILKNIQLPFKILVSLFKIFKIINRFRPDLALGTGGYASAPTLKMAQWMGVPTFIQEQNALPGYTNRFLGTDAKCVFISFEESIKYFPNKEVVYTGNAIRESFADGKIDRQVAFDFFKLDSKKKTVFVTGGSLGARAINEGIAEQFDVLMKNDIQILWQTGKTNLQNYKHFENHNCRVFDFITDMQYAYAAADLIVTRAGGVLFELFVIGKPAIVLPSPYVAEDHQTHNAESLVKKNAVIMIKDKDSKVNLVPSIVELIRDENKMHQMGTMMKSLAKPYAASEIAKKILSTIEE